MAGVVGLEPTNAGVKVPCLNRLGYTPITPGANGISCRKQSNGTSSRARTCDNLINSQVLYRLSYRGVMDSNESFNRQLPILPARHQASTFDLWMLNYCVRYGNRWIHPGIITGYLIERHVLSKLYRRNFLTLWIKR